MREGSSAEGSSVGTPTRFRPVQPRVVLTRSTITAVGVAATAILVPAVVPGRIPALLSTAGIALAVVALARGQVQSWSRAALATFVGLAGGLLLLGAVHDAGITAQQPAMIRLTFASAWALTTGTLGAAVALRPTGRRGIVDVWLRIGGAMAAGGFVAGALLRLLLPGRGTADRLAWLLYEEDNAAFVGVAREVLVDGHRGADLAAEFGAAFANLPAALLVIAGGPLSTEGDVRLQAVTLTVVSTIVAISLGTLAMALIGGLLHHASTSRTSGSPRSSLWVIAAGPLLTGAATFTALALLVVLPMRTGFLTLVWGLALVAISAALVAVTPPDSSAQVRIIVGMCLLAAGLLLTGSWPFIGPALVPVLIAVAAWLPWNAIVTSARSNPLRTTVVAIGLLVVAGLLGVTLVSSGAAATVIGMGTAALTVQGSLISADRTVITIGMLAVLAVTLLSRRLDRDARRIVLLAVLGPPLGGIALYAGLRIAANILTDGVLGYSGMKLLYAVVVLTVLLGLPAAAALVTRSGTAACALAVVALAVPILNSPTVALQYEWWDRTDRGSEPHAIATVTAIRASSEDLPIRCLPSRETAVTERTRWAAYMCIRWMEEAFNGSGWGYARSFVEAEGPTFEDVINARIEARPSDYFFAYPFTMGMGWFGWDGTDRSE
jgi:hypothetical protein